MPTTPGGLPILDKVTTIIGQVFPAVNGVVALAELAVELIRRKQSGDPEMSLAEMGEYLQVRGQAMQDISNQWLTTHGYDAQGNRILDAHLPGGDPS